MEVNPLDLIKLLVAVQVNLAGSSKVVVKINPLASKAVVVLQSVLPEAMGAFDKGTPGPTIATRRR